MYLKSITLKGFKSFPDRTRLEFGPGVSVIVGPNGSGKSNVTDAVLWALGEQSPMAVRGQSMQDVIFAGAPGRQAARSAEVELVLDDAAESLALGVPEISIVRRLDRTGDGEYRLAGARCRLVDVIDMLSDTGLGKEMHSVISQGRVEAIVTSKPRDRRLLIEEAAGLGKHRKRRRRAQLKLARTQDNLDRALDVEREARSRLRPLKRQAEAAELHARIERQSIEARWELCRDDLRARLTALREAQADAAQARARREQVEHELREVSERREAAEEALAARSALREELSRRCFVAQGAADRVGYRAEAVRGAAAGLDDRLARRRQLLSSLQAEDAADAPEEGLPERITALQAELTELEQQRETELGRALADLEGKLMAADAELQERALAASRSREQRSGSEAALDRGRQILLEAERGVQAARQEAARVGAELAVVNQFLDSYQSRTGGESVLAEELEVDAGYELALAAVLDGRLRATLADDRKTASALLDRTGAGGGRALVPPSPRGSVPDDRAPPPVAEAERLLDHARGAERAMELLRTLLLDTWVVDSIDAVPDSFNGVAVTREGRVWAPSTREVRQASAVGDERVLAERNRREQLVRDSERAVQAEQAARIALGRAAADVAELEAACERALEHSRAAVRARDEADEERHRIAAVLDRRRSAPDEGPDAGRRSQVVAELAARQAALQHAERARAQRRSTLERLRAEIARDGALTPIVSGVIVSLQAAADAIAERRATFDAALSADREAGEHVAGQLRTCAQQEAALHARLHGENESLTELEVRAQRVRDQVADTEHGLRELAARLELTAEPAPEPLSCEERAALDNRLERLARRGEQLGPVNPLAQDEYADAVEHVEELERQRADLETALRELERLIADTDRQIREKFEETFQAAADNFEELAAQLFPGGHGRLRLVAEREGPARVLGGASSDPPPPHSEEADELEDSVDEEQQLGVEIEITPAGKDMKRLSLLSGGEKSMTALAFLFAVFLAKPCPFYILDEVEAALDDANIDRFLDLLRRNAQRAQFIVVTHQKRTMEAADSLYGVSMGGDGISKVVSRRLPPQEIAA